MRFIRNVGLRAPVVLIGALLLTACSLGQLKGGSSNSSSKRSDDSSPGSAAFSPSADARKDLGDAFRKLKAAYPYRLTETTSGTMNGKTTMPENKRVVDFAAADRSHLKWTGGIGGNIEEITIGDKRYWYSEGKWSEDSRPSADERAKRGAELEKALASATKDVKYMGPETVNGMPCFAYTYTLDFNVSGNSYPGSGKAWVGAADGLPHQNDSEFSFKSYNQKSHIVYEYNVDFKVEKPIF